MQRERSILECAVQAVSERAAAASALVDEAVDAVLDVWGANARSHAVTRQFPAFSIMAAKVLGG